MVDDGWIDGFTNEWMDRMVDDGWMDKMMHFLWRCHLTRFSKHNLQKYFQEKSPEPIIFAPFSKGHHSMEDGGREGFWSVASYKPTCRL